MSDKIVNVYVGECFQEGGQVGGEGKTYGLSLSGNKLKIVENGQQSEVDLPSGGGGSAELPKETKDKIDELTKYVYLMKAFNGMLPVPKEVYSDNVNNFMMNITGTGEIDRPYVVSFLGVGAYPRDIPLSLTFPKNYEGQNITQYPDFDRLMYDGQVFSVMGNEVTYHADTHSLDISKLPLGVHSFSLVNT